VYQACRYSNDNRGKEKKGDLTAGNHYVASGRKGRIGGNVLTVAEAQVEHKSQPFGRKESFTVSCSVKAGDQKADL
jgi:hypothetical protein